jgi:hypothetical protein
MARGAGHKAQGKTHKISTNCIKGLEPYAMHLNHLYDLGIILFAIKIKNTLGSQF